MSPVLITALLEEDNRCSWKLCKVGLEFIFWGASQEPLKHPQKIANHKYAVKCSIWILKKASRPLCYGPLLGHFLSHPTFSLCNNLKKFDILENNFYLLLLQEVEDYIVWPSCLGIKFGAAVEWIALHTDWAQREAGSLIYRIHTRDLSLCPAKMFTSYCLTHLIYYSKTWLNSYFFVVCRSLVSPCEAAGFLLSSYLTIPTFQASSYVLVSKL